MERMTKRQGELVDEFAKITKEKNYCDTVYFMVGAISFSDEAWKASKSDEILEDIIKIAKNTESEKQFVDEVLAKYVF